MYEKLRAHIGHNIICVAYGDIDKPQDILLNEELGIKLTTKKFPELKEYIGKCYEIIETSEKVYISKDFPDEFCHSTDKTKLRGAFREK